MKYDIRPENAALGIKKAPCPLIPKVLKYLKSLVNSWPINPIVVDQGCGKLRNLSSLIEISSNLVLVDTPTQINTPHLFFNKKQLIAEYIESNYDSRTIKVLTSEQFENGKINANLIFSINVFDVLPPFMRMRPLEAAIKNLSGIGYYILIVPRNDSRTLSLCKPDNEYCDGHIFPNHGAHTFYKNWKTTDLIKILNRTGFKIVEDMSIYRYACLICNK